MTRRLLASLALAVLISAPAWTHHNMSAIFDFNDVVTQTGSLVELDWRNPHIYIFVDVDTDGESERWSFEGPPPNFFRNRNVDREAFESFMGQSVTVVASRARDGSESGLIREVTLTDGTVVSACPQNC
jgi:hypothetical protein